MTTSIRRGSSVRILLFGAVCFQVFLFVRVVLGYQDVELSSPLRFQVFKTISKHVTVVTFGFQGHRIVSKCGPVVTLLLPGLKNRLLVTGCFRVFFVLAWGTKM